MQFQLTTDRGKIRMEKLRQLELEQLQWEQEALVMPEVRSAPFIPAHSRDIGQDLNRALHLSFESVKTEFSDLDGLSWPRYPVPLVTNPWVGFQPMPLCVTHHHATGSRRANAETHPCRNIRISDRS